jgi:hypothetical protein
MKMIQSSETFDGKDLMSVGLNREHETGADWLPIEKNRACPTHAMLAAHMGAGQTEFVAQKIT